MKRVFIIPIIIGGILLVAGSVVFGLAIANRSQTEAIINEHPLTEGFNGLNIKTSTSNIVFEVSSDGSKKVVCNETTKEYHTVNVVDNVLTVDYVDELKWYERIFNFDFSKRQITFYLPIEAYGDLVIKSSTGDIKIPEAYSFASMDVSLSTGDVNVKSNVTGLTKIKTSTGNISLSDLNTNSLELGASTGKVSLTNVNVQEDVQIKVSTGRVNTDNLKAKNLTIETSTGAVTLKDTVIEEHIGVNTDTGDVIFEKSDAATLNVKTHTGDVKGSLLTKKICYPTSHTGRIKVPESSEGGIFRIETDTGDINITYLG